MRATWERSIRGGPCCAIVSSLTIDRGSFFVKFAARSAIIPAEMFLTNKILLIVSQCAFEMINALAQSIFRMCQYDDLIRLSRRSSLGVIAMTQPMADFTPVFR
jgi:hypothetical protein